MSRLDDLLSMYGQEKEREKDVKANLNMYGTELKTVLEKGGITAHKGRDYKLTYKTTERCTLNEEVLLNILKTKISEAPNEEVKQSIQEAIITVERVRESVVEDLIFNNIISVEDIEPSYETKEIKVLRVAPIKNM